MKRTIRRTVARVAIVAAICCTASGLAVDWMWSAPPWAVRAFEGVGVGLSGEGGGRFVVTRQVNPGTLFGDFDGDGRTDVAVLVRERSSSKVGIAIARQGGEVAILGAGTDFGNGGDDFAWLDHWFTYTQDVVHPGADESAPPTLRGDALWVEKSESASALIYWSGSEFRWYQQGD
jgi:hypothetical protein